ncbi:MAG: hypothetical protein GY820_03750 [Gammaproteobacteria bacterium]|nr:hypothetical protein [Gammaproteobacteria bacterium]
MNFKRIGLAEVEKQENAPRRATFLARRVDELQAFESYRNAPGGGSWRHAF